MHETIFWDTSAFVALGNSDDVLHRVAVQISEELARQHAHILTTDVVLVEVINTFSREAWRPIAQRMVKAVWESVHAGAAEVVHVDEALWRHGWQLFLRRPHNDWSMTDCISFVVMQEHDIVRAFTSNPHYEQAGLIRLLRRPMVGQVPA
jgi:predicted nucleic acid-binding protein